MQDAQVHPGSTESRATVASPRCTTLKSVFSGAAPLDASLERACNGRLGCDVIQGWGLTETSPVVTTNHNTPQGPRPGSVGVPLPNTELRVVDPATGADVSRGETGELLVRGPQVMKGYLNQPEATARTVDADGWLHTGDVASVDDDGYVYIVDRIKDGAIASSMKFPQFKNVGVVFVRIVETVVGVGESLVIAYH